VVQKDFAVDGNFDFSSVLLDTNSTTFEDNNPNYFAKNYYKVCAVDTAGNFGCSHPTYGFINDTIPPSNPVGISGKIDSNGVMTLSWEQNRERDLKGYNVYYSNSQDGVYSKLTSYAIRDTMYTDTLTLNTLTENIYYAITAEDIRDNVSNFSNRIQLEKPDTIPPGPSVFKEYNIKENGIELVWSPSYSRDAVTQQLWRSENVEKELIATFDNNISAYLDTLVQGGQVYTYSLVVIDDSNLSTKCPQNLTIKANWGDLRPKITLNHVIDDENNYVSYTSQCDNLDRIVILKASEKGPFITYKTLKKSEDIIIKNPESKLRFKAIAYSKSGLTSEASELTIK